MDDIYRKVLDELHGVLIAVDEPQIEAALGLIAGSRRIALYGVGDFCEGFSQPFGRGFERDGSFRRSSRGY